MSPLTKFGVSGMQPRRVRARTSAGHGVTAFFGHVLHQSLPTCEHKHAIRVEVYSMSMAKIAI
jgi:hypothetical protein